MDGTTYASFVTLFRTNSFLPPELTISRLWEGGDGKFSIMRTSEGQNLKSHARVVVGLKRSRASPDSCKKNGYLKLLLHTLR